MTVFVHIQELAFCIRLQEYLHTRSLNLGNIYHSFAIVPAIGVLHPKIAARKKNFYDQLVLSIPGREFYYVVVQIRWFTIFSYPDGIHHRI